MVIQKNARTHCFDSITEVPYCKVGLLLGTSKYLKNGRLNLYYQYRIEAAKQLIKTNKIKYLIISGDNGQVNYDEPSEMKRSLIESGVDSSIIYLDFAGFRTYDSVIRAREIFGQKALTIISQKFHNERAIYIGHKLDMNVNGFNAKDVTQYAGIKTKIREKLARVKVMFDFLLGISPRFFGPKVNIENSSN